MLDANTRRRALKALIRQCGTVSLTDPALSARLEQRLCRRFDPADWRRYQLIRLLDRIDAWLGHPFYPVCVAIGHSPWWMDDAIVPAFGYWSVVLDSFKYVFLRGYWEDALDWVFQRRVETLQVESLLDGSECDNADS